MKAPAHSGPPTDEGERLATIGRGAGKELRLRFRRYNGVPFIDVRQWECNPESGAWWPTKGKGVTIKPRELAEVIKALGAARELSR